MMRLQEQVARRSELEGEIKRNLAGGMSADWPLKTLKECATWYSGGMTQVARASLEELKLDYEDFLRQRGLAQWGREHPLRQELVDRRLQSADEVARWVAEVSRRPGGCGHGGLDGPGGHGEAPGSESTASTKSTLSTKVYPELAANAVLVLLAVACALLDRQVARLADDFTSKGGFTERLYRVRKQKRGL